RLQTQPEDAIGIRRVGSRSDPTGFD
ncbi:MAG: hypothetical protein JWQ76_5487, partial [Ramlibacter sp.]|nr:hypothetical protein [Ramlibacter sp.]